jgi:hypothetical protein
MTNFKIITNSLFKQQQNLELVLSLSYSRAKGLCIERVMFIEPVSEVLE